MPRWFVHLLCLLTLLACTPLAHAQTTQPVYRCIGAHGEPVFSGQPCGTPAPQPGHAAATQGGRFAGACAGSPQALRQAIASAFATRDVNRLAGLILWRGMDQVSARATLHSLAGWLKQPLAGIALSYANGPPSGGPGASLPSTSTDDPASASSTAAPPPVGLEVSTGGGDGSTRDFGITRSGDCWWLTF